MEYFLDNSMAKSSMYLLKRSGDKIPPYKTPC